jgi:hypothetical protein
MRAAALRTVIAPATAANAAAAPTTTAAESADERPANAGAGRVNASGEERTRGERGRQPHPAEGGGDERARPQHDDAEQREDQRAGESGEHRERTARAAGQRDAHRCSRKHGEKTGKPKHGDLPRRLRSPR